MLHVVHPSPICSSQNHPKFHSNHYYSSSSKSSHPPVLLRFRPSHRQKTQFLLSLGIETTTNTSPEVLEQILHVVDYLQKKGFSNSDFPRLSFLCPQIFSPANTNTTPDLETLFSFLASEISASPDQSRFLIYKCPELLSRSVEYRLGPTVEYLKRDIGVRNLNSPTTLNAHLINTPIEKLVARVDFLEDQGLTFEESASICRRLPAIFGYSLEFNLRPKVEFLVEEMERSIEEVVKFPQYFAFSLEKRILPRHLHLKRRLRTRVPLPKILMYSDQKFYEIWK